MLTKEQISELKMHLEKAQNPVFYYDNDADGLCSFLLLRRATGKGYGVAIKSYPELDEKYAEKALHFKADYVFVLDKPIISSGFVSQIEKMNIPLIWIDHHAPQGQIHKNNNLFVFNPALKGEGIPTSAIIFEVVKKENWLALIGCVSDCYVPEFANEVRKEYPEMFSKKEMNAFDILYKTEFGKIVRALNYGLKDSVSNVIKMQNYLTDCNSPLKVLEEGEENKRLREKFSELSKKQESFVSEAEKNVEGNLLFFVYSGSTSMSSDIANELAYRNKDKYIIVCYQRGVICNLSIRGKKVNIILDKILKEFEYASGGGHEDAVGARILSKNIEKFKERFKDEIAKESYSSGMNNLA